MKKLKLIVKREYLAKVRNRSFVVMTFLSPILMVGMVVLIAYLTKLNEGELRVITVLNESDYFSNSFSPTETLSYLQFDGLTIEEAKDSTAALGYYGLLHIPHADDLEKVADSTVFYSTSSPISEVLAKIENIFQMRLREHRLQVLGLSGAQYVNVEKKFDVEIATFEGEKKHRGP